MRDRITTLSDPVLIRIVSFLPINKAASTSILSKRWQYVWTGTTSLRMPQISVDGNGFTFYRTLIQCAKQLCWDNLDTIELHFLPGYNNYNTDETINNTWTAVIRDLISGQNVRVIKINFECRKQNSEGPKLPSYIFDMPLLHTLELSSRFDLKLPKNGVINWPCLTKLDIHVNCSQLGLLGRIVASCLLLEELTIHALLQYAKSCLNLCSESLRRLYVEIEYLRSYGTGNEKPVLRILSDAPMLQDVDFTGGGVVSIALQRNFSTLV